jgi:anti-sigma B factor antagonist
MLPCGYRTVLALPTAHSIAALRAHCPTGPGSGLTSPDRLSLREKLEERMNNPLRLGIDIQRVSGLPVLAVSGEIDIYTAPLFKQAVVNLVSEGNKNVVIDLGGVTFMDSSGFGTLLGATRRLRPLGGGLYLAGANNTIQRMLKLTRLDSIMEIYPTREDAVSAISQAGQEVQAA